MINRYLFVTFPSCCNDLAKSIMPLKDIKEQYSLLFASENLIKEFKNLQDTDVENLIKNLKTVLKK